ncbi:hypothetical protein AB0F13_08015 [Streptomyces sp. NPDC026206]|uniref:hypothetical protein n=1 Tax=Streptomyces sp. NPDC026206 TaxID=3157089 RepID=UPI0033C23C25
MDDEVLRSVYETERHDEQNTAGLIIAVTTGTLAYFAAAAAYLADQQRQSKIQPEFLLAAPFPLLILTGYVTFQYAASRVRQSYLMHLEAQLSAKSWNWHANFPGFMTLHQGLFSGWTTNLWPFAALTILTFVSHVVIVIGFTAYACYIAYRSQAEAIIFWAVSSLYGLLISVNILAVFEMIRFSINPRGAHLKTLRSVACKTAASERVRWQDSRY